MDNYLKTSYAVVGIFHTRLAETDCHSFLETVQVLS